MSVFELTILGASSAMPVLHRYPSSQILNINNTLYLIDCGEGTQRQMLKYNIKWHKIDYIFISHTHGDHYLGLVPLIDTLSMGGRQKPLYIFAPPALEQVLNLHFEIAHGKARFQIVFFPTQAQHSQIILNTPNVSVETIILDHGIACTGFLFKEKTPLRKIKKEAIDQYNIPHSHITEIKEGKNFTLPNGLVIDNKLLTDDPPPPRSYAYCSDSAFKPDICTQIKNVNVLYHEATYDASLAEIAHARHHSTTHQAAQIALQANAQTLLIGHLSARYKVTQPLLNEAQTIFKNTMLAIEGRTYTI